MFVFTVQSDVFVGVVTVIYGRNKPFHRNGRVSLGVMAAFDIHVESNFPEFVVSQQFAQLEFRGLYRAGIGEISLFLIGTELDVCLYSTYVRTHFTVGNQIREVPGYFSPEGYRTQML